MCCPKCGSDKIEEGRLMLGKNSYSWWFICKICDYQEEGINYNE